MLKKISYLVLKDGTRYSLQEWIFSKLTVLLICIGFAMFIVVAAVEIAVLIDPKITILSHWVGLGLCTLFNIFIAFGYGYWFIFAKQINKAKEQDIISYKYNYEQLYREKAALQLQLDSLKRDRKNQVIELE